MESKGRQLAASPQRLSCAIRDCREPCAGYLALVENDNAPSLVAVLDRVSAVGYLFDEPTLRDWVAVRRDAFGYLPRWLG